MVPTRIISEGLGASVAWNQKLKTVNIGLDGSNLQLTSGGKTALVNGSSVALDASVEIKSGRVMVPRGLSARTWVCKSNGTKRHSVSR